VYASPILALCITAFNNRTSISANCSFPLKHPCPGLASQTAATRDLSATANTPCFLALRMLSEICMTSLHGLHNSELLSLMGGRFLHLTLRAPTRNFRIERVGIAWSVIRRKHPLLMAKVVVDDDDLGTARFSLVSITSRLPIPDCVVSFTPSLTSDDAIQEAALALRVCHDTRDGTHAKNW
jgi:hypothetical protein